ncbi:MAG: hypothetical protein ABI862_01405 [Ilumatobacteraceae bacterium]
MRLLMTPMFAGPRQCWAQFTAETLNVRMGRLGWAFNAAIPRSSISEGEPYDGPVFGWGAHGWRGRWLVNGSSQGLVTIRINPPARVRAVFIPLRVSELTLSLEDPSSFIDVVRRTAPS